MSTNPLMIVAPAPDGFEERYAAFKAESAIAYAAVRRDLLATFSVEQLSMLNFLGVSEAVWRDAIAELDRRGALR